MTDSPSPKAQRLNGLDLARFFAFAGMVIVNFKIAMGVTQTTGFAARFTALFEGRAAATFVVLAGVGLGLAAARTPLAQMRWVTLKRALFLFVAGVLNLTIFEADILHYYALYFLVGLAVLPLSTRALIALIATVAFGFVLLTGVLDYEAGWNWETLDYAGLWTPTGFARNLLFNGWHPVIPWVAFLLFGLILARLPLAQTRCQTALIWGGAGVMLAAELASAVLMPLAARVDPELVDLLGTSPIPPVPLYLLAGGGAAAMVIGLCLRIAPWLAARGALTPFTAAGRQALTLYIAHIIVGMGALEMLGLLGGQSAAAALFATVLFCALAMIYALIWSHYLGRGPLERLMRWVAG